MDAGEQLIALFALGLGIGVLVLRLCLRFRGERRKRELEHIERLTAIEVGRSYPGEITNKLLALPPSAIPYVIAALIGALVPVAVFGCALLSTLLFGIQKDIWIAAGMVGLASVMCGATLAGTVFQSSQSACEAEDSRSFVNSKPHIDEDAYDVVSARG
jgi:hypothetical protein